MSSFVYNVLYQKFGSLLQLFFLKIDDTVLVFILVDLYVQKVPRISFCVYFESCYTYFLLIFWNIWQLNFAFLWNVVDLFSFFFCENV